MSSSSIPFFSIIVSSHNSGSFLQESIDSCLTQSFTNFEIIIVDSGSIDESLDFLFDADLVNIRLLSLRSCSADHARGRNVGASLASGKYICFLDAGDVWHPAMLKVKHELLLTTKADLITTDFDPIFGAISAAWPINDHVNCLSYSRIEFWPSVYSNKFNLSATSVLTQKFLEFDESQDISGVEGYELWLRMLSYHYSAVKISASLGSFRVTPSFSAAKKKYSQLIKTQKIFCFYQVGASKYLWFAIFFYKQLVRIVAVCLKLVIRLR